MRAVKRGGFQKGKGLFKEQRGALKGRGGDSQRGYGGWHPERGVQHLPHGSSSIFSKDLDKKQNVHNEAIWQMVMAATSLIKYCCLAVVHCTLQM